MKLNRLIHQTQTRPVMQYAKVRPSHRRLAVAGQHKTPIATATPCARRRRIGERPRRSSIQRHRRQEDSRQSNSDDRLAAPIRLRASRPRRAAPSRSRAIPPPRGVGTLMRRPLVGPIEDLPAAQQRDQHSGRHTGEQSRSTTAVPLARSSASFIRPADPGRRDRWRFLGRLILPRLSSRLASNRPTHRGAPGRDGPAQHQLLLFRASPDPR